MISMSNYSIILVFFFFFINLLSHIKFFLYVPICTNISIVILWCAITSNKRHINPVAIILCGIIQDLFDENIFMTSSIIYLLFYGVLMLQNFLIFNKNYYIDLAYYSVMLLLLVVSRDLIISASRDLNMELTHSFNAACITSLLYITIHLISNRFIIYK